MMDDGVTTAERLITLGSVPSGARAIVSRLQGGRRMAARMANLGVYPGALVTVVSNGGFGPVVIKAQGARLALGRGMAEKALVRRTG